MRYHALWCLLVGVLKSAMRYPGCWASPDGGWTVWRPTMFSHHVNGEKQTTEETFHVEDKTEHEPTASCNPQWKIDSSTSRELLSVEIEVDILSRRNSIRQGFVMLLLLDVDTWGSHYRTLQHEACTRCIYKRVGMGVGGVFWGLVAGAGFWEPMAPQKVHPSGVAHAYPVPGDWEGKEKTNQDRKSVV